MRSIGILGYYFVWHYTSAFADVLRVFGNMLWFVYHFFSIPNLLLTFFSPFQRMQEGFGRGFDPEDIASVILINTIMRVIGVVLRTIVIVIGIASLALVLVVGVLVFLLWAFVPFIVIGLFLAGLTLLLFP